MTIQTDSRTTSEMLTDGSNKVFYFGFPIFKGDNGQKGVEVRFVNDLGFDVVDPSLFAVIEDSDNSGGIVQFYEAPEAGKRLAITGNTPVDQQLDITNYNRFHGASIETNFDKIIAIAQEFFSKLNEEIRQRINNNLEVRDYVDNKLSELEDWAISQIPDIAKSQFDLMLNDFKMEWQNALNTITLKDGVPTLAVMDESGKSQQEINDAFKVPSVDALKLTDPRLGKINLLSYNAGQGEGGGEFAAVQSSSLVENLVTSFRCAVVGFEDWFWVRINYDHLTLEMGGAKGDDPANDDYLACQRVMDIDKQPIRAGWKTYYISQPLILKGNDSFVGCGANKTKFEKTTTTTSGLPSFVWGASTVVMDVDAVLIVDDAASSSGVHLATYKEIGGFSLNRSTSVQNVGYGLYGSRISLSYLHDIRSNFSKTGIYSRDIWMTRLHNVTSRAAQPFLFQAGTSLDMTNCWAMTGGADYYAYNFENVLYSTMTACGGDYLGTDGNPIAGFIRCFLSQITVMGLGYENTHMNRFCLSHGVSSRLYINGVRGVSNKNTYKTGNGAWLECAAGGYLDINNVGFGLTATVSDTGVPNFIYIRGGGKASVRDSNIVEYYSGSQLNNTDSDIELKYGGFELRDYKSTVNTMPRQITTNQAIYSSAPIIGNGGKAIDTVASQSIVNSGDYHYNSGSDPMSYHLLHHFPHRSDTNIAWQMGVRATATDMSQLKARMKVSGVWTTPATIYNSDNVIVDENGFLKLKT